MKHIQTEILVIGSGAAGLNYAINASKNSKVLIVTKKELITSNTNNAQGGVAAVMSPDDDFSLHKEDTIRTGAGLCDEDAVTIMVQEAPKQILELMKLGVRFTKNGDVLAMSRESGHSRARIVHSKDKTGNAIEKILVKTVKAGDLEILKNTIVFDLYVENGICKGAYAYNVKNKAIYAIQAKVTILATGGSGQLFMNNTNPGISTGDGLALGYRAGANLQDLEFVQFHPTMLDITPNPSFLISETLRGEGGHLIDSKGKRFMHKYHEMKELAPRDIVTRAIMSEKKKGQIFLDISFKDSEFIKKRFPMIYKKCKKFGIDITTDKIPVVPAAHYQCGGVKTDINGLTNINGLYSFGETACTGVHGANRLASNSLLESLVFSERAYRHSMETVKKNKTGVVPEIKINACTTPAYNAKKIKKKVRKIMWDSVGIIRCTKELESALEKLKELQKKAEECWKNCISKDSIEARNMTLSAVLITQSALTRKESRGTHYIKEYPKPKKEWEKHIIWNVALQNPLLK